jgi:hypothetical protein
MQKKSSLCKGNFLLHRKSGFMSYSANHRSRHPRSIECLFQGRAEPLPSVACTDPLHRIHAILFTTFNPDYHRLTASSLGKLQHHNLHIGCIMLWVFMVHELIRTEVHVIAFGCSRVGLHKHTRWTPAQDLFVQRRS